MPKKAVKEMDKIVIVDAVTPKQVKSQAINRVILARY
jgi:hypothetical protein